MIFFSSLFLPGILPGYKNLPRKPRPLAAEINWQKIFKKRLGI